MGLGSGLESGGEGEPKFVAILYVIQIYCHLCKPIVWQPRSQAFSSLRIRVGERAFEVASV